MQNAYGLKSKAEFNCYLSISMGKFIKSLTVKMIVEIRYVASIAKPTVKRIMFSDTKTMPIKIVGIIDKLNSTKLIFESFFL